ncbi:MFS nicotinic acid transporter Tna1, putative [Cordyceps militaris CM01]|uniref:MFS nicotinic acid transporter Tna1, putative n=1 Tax=Cordyceps militaris (strain CM01) TaxID=983644 RepID=G3J479_CORMM|nr:MFS nicotinic acid transporter Tna1, putative [Cordyceps militaris CM01]EGX95801.1 MFS nicotinic acid transporter Tna1, putative [Cordyceps militaris CM01]
MHDPQEVGRILRKMDWRILPFLAVPYLLSYMDRGNIGNAKVAGMNTDMGLTDKQYNICLMVFFFTYSLFEVPSNIVLKLMPPSRWIGIMMLGWGTAMTLQGLVRQYSHLIATRLVLGLFEAGLFPAATYLLTTWYCRFELQTRMSIFFAAASLAGAFSGILAFAISKMNGIGGLEGWRWIFILEGLLTIVVAVVIPFVLPDSPETAKFLSDDEKAIVIHRLRHDSGTESGIVGTGEKFQWKYLIAAMLDWKLYLSIFIYWGHSIPIYAFTFTAPTIIRQLGYSAANAQLLTIPVYFFGALTTVVVSRLADRYKCRWVFITGAYAVSTVAFIGLLAIPHPRLPGLTYALLFLITGGLYPAIIGLIAWIANNLAPSWKRAVGMAFLMGFGNLGGAVSSNIFIASQAPHYWIGYGMCLALVVVAILATVVMRVTLSKINRQRDALDEDEIRAMYSDAQLVEMGDRSPLVRYVL